MISDSKTCMILVSNLPQDANEDFLELFFENRDRQGGGPVKSVEINQEDNTAIIEFQDPECRWNQ